MDYRETKKVVLENDLVKEWREASRKSFFDNDTTGLLAFKEHYGDMAYRCCKNLETSKRNKTKRAKKKIGKSVKAGRAYFITLTFKDEVLAKTSQETRRRYVSRFLKANCGSYVANIDYGSQKEREHYHALVEPYWWVFEDYINGNRHYTDMPDFRQWNKYGFFTIEAIGNTDKDLVKVTKYTAKLSAHALKESTLNGDRTPRLIYSRRAFRIKALPNL